MQRELHFRDRDKMREISLQATGAPIPKKFGELLNVELELQAMTCYDPKRQPHLLGRWLVYLTAWVPDFNNFKRNAGCGFGYLPLRLKYIIDIH